MIGFLGGTGPEGRGLALRFARAGKDTLIGSRVRDRAVQVADELARLAPVGSISGATNEDVATRSDPVFISVPYIAQRDILVETRDLLAGKVVVDVVAPVSVRKGIARAIPVPEGSAALQAQALLPESFVVAAFQTISATDLLMPDKPVDSDVIVCADNAQAKAVAMDLASEIPGLRAVDGSDLQNSQYVENFAALLINIGQTYRAHPSIRIMGI